MSTQRDMSEYIGDSRWADSWRQPVGDEVNL
jgi:hypothetical protein